MMDLTQRGKKQPSVINTKHILFVVSGAFGGLEKIVRKRVREASIGFAAASQAQVSDEQVLQHVETRDFIEFGFEPEFIGRLPVRVVCHHLSVDDLVEILKSSEGSIIRQYEQSFSAYGIEVLFRDLAISLNRFLASSCNFVGLARRAGGMETIVFPPQLRNMKSPIRPLHPWKGESLSSFIRL